MRKIFSKIFVILVILRAVTICDLLTRAITVLFGRLKDGAKYIKHSFVFVLLFCLFGCESRQTLAPVVESNWRAVSHYADRHVVAKGETLYSIAFRYDKDYRHLAAYNRLSSPYTVYVGQVLHFSANRAQNKIIAHGMRRISRPKKLASFPQHQMAVMQTMPKNDGHVHDWMWPIHGKIINAFMPGKGNKGINIAGRPHDKIVAVSGGVVAYAGNGLAGYGNLIIIKHNNEYMTAYGNNARNLVHEGQIVRIGQKIAEIGVVDRQYWGVHFEIRKMGQPVNPLRYLK